MSFNFIKHTNNMWKRPLKNKIYLGRWGTIVTDNSETNQKRDKSIEFNIDNANHDHCGSELCVKKDVKKSDYQKFKFIFDDEHYPYII